MRSLGTLGSVVYAAALPLTTLRARAPGLCKCAVCVCREERRCAALPPVDASERLHDASGMPPKSVCDAKRRQVARQVSSAVSSSSSFERMFDIYLPYTTRIYLNHLHRNWKINAAIELEQRKRSAPVSEERQGERKVLCARFVCQQLVCAVVRASLRAARALCRVGKRETETPLARFPSPENRWRVCNQELIKSMRVAYAF